MANPRKIKENWDIKRKCGLTRELNPENNYSSRIIPFKGEPIGEYLIDRDKKEIKFVKYKTKENN